jgi:hypothetical protein
MSLAAAIPAGEYVPTEAMRDFRDALRNRP